MPVIPGLPENSFMKLSNVPNPGIQIHYFSMKLSDVNQTQTYIHPSPHFYAQSASRNIFLPSSFSRPNHDTQKRHRTRNILSSSLSHTHLSFLSQAHNSMQPLLQPHHRRPPPTTTRAHPMPTPRTFNIRAHNSMHTPLFILHH